MYGPTCIGRTITSSLACTPVCEAKSALDQSLPYVVPSHRDNTPRNFERRNQIPQRRPLTGLSHWMVTSMATMHYWAVGNVGRISRITLRAMRGRGVTQQQCRHLSRRVGHE